MATISAGFSRSTFNFSRPFSSSPISSRPSFSRARFSRSSASMDSSDELRSKFMEFPYVSGSHRDLMVDLLSSVETRLGSSLESCTLPPDVQHFENSTGSARGSLHLRSGLPSSQLPSGEALNITTLSAYLKPSTDAPHFLLDLIQTGPTSLVLILDLTPRKDLILYSDYLKKYYEDTNLDRHRVRIDGLPEAKPYFSPSLYVRSLLSPTAILVSVGGERSVEDVIREHVGPVAREVLDFWIGLCSCAVGSVGGKERDCLVRRDGIIKRTTVEVDLGSSFPRLFGHEVADRVLGALRGYYGK
ncbi:red chlorophyll catabolite reductase [Striga asiatica]|uniref:Red chlorophyll catabolite reductase n=1 Tax=Striga asiatica TaxID=4170 RepID=A0A5A7PDL9_STRAF|nr:red chlorophyll catabolite reductase [Striga asiatica]